MAEQHETIRQPEPSKNLPSTLKPARPATSGKVLQHPVTDKTVGDARRCLQRLVPVCTFVTLDP
jgi:hypothetical protein